MSDPTTPALRAANADREQTVAVLREHAVEGRLSLEEFTDRMSSAYLAGTKDQLDELLSDLPSGTVPVSRRKPTRFVFSVLGSSVCDLVGRRHRCLARAACVVAANLARSDPRNPLRQAQKARVIGGPRSAAVSRPCESP